MKEGTHNELSQSMLLGYTLVKMAVLARDSNQGKNDPFYDIFASIARREANALRIETEITDTTKGNLSAKAEMIRDELNAKHSGDCSSLFQLGLGLSAATMQREPPNDEVKTQLLLLAVLCNLSDQVAAILDSPESDRERKIAELIKYVDTHPRIVTHGSRRRNSDTASELSTASTLPYSLAVFMKDHPIADDTCFIMMRFGNSDAHRRIAASIKRSLAQWDIVGLRADDKQYHDELYSNIVTYMHGCGMGIAVYECIETEAFNPNIALEVGYMLALRKPVLLLKDKNLRVLQADLVGRLYHEFDPQNPEDTIPPVVERWLRDKHIIK